MHFRLWIGRKEKCGSPLKILEIAQSQKCFKYCLATAVYRTPLPSSNLYHEIFKHFDSSHFLPWTNVMLNTNDKIWLRCTSIVSTHCNAQWMTIPMAEDFVSIDTPQNSFYESCHGPLKMICVKNKCPSRSINGFSFICCGLRMVRKRVKTPLLEM